MARPGQIARRAGANTARAVRRLLSRAILPREGRFWVALRLAPPIDETSPLMLPFSRESHTSLLEVLETLECAADDPSVDGVLLHFAGAPTGWSKLLSLRRAIESARERGVPVVAWAETLDTESLLAASAATRIWLPEVGNVFLVGMRAEGFFLRGLLDRLEIRPEIVRVGTHKTAAESFTRDRMSPEEREQLESLVDDLFEQIVNGIAAGRGLAPDRVRELIDRGPYTARAAVDVGLADACLYADEIERALEPLSPVPPDESPGPRRARLVDGATYHALRARDPGWRPLLAGLPRLAYVVGRGTIHRGSGPRGIASEPFAQLFERLRSDEGVRGVVLRLDTGGGDGMASDLLWRAVDLLVREKPVVVSMGDVAASGGYYVAAAADAVYAEAGTLTGSIGVVGGKVNLEGLYRRLGIGRDAVERGARAGLLSEARGFTADERAAVKDEMAAVYAAFVDRVARGRRLSEAQVHRVAQGRVWSGGRARAVGLVDAIGGPLEALREVRRRAGLRAGDRVILEVHPKTPRLPGLSALRRSLRR